MVMVRRRTFLAGILAGAAALALRALPAAAQSVALKQALLGFEDGVSWAAVSPVFAAQRPIWLNNVRGSRSPSELGAQLLRLEAAMGWSSVQNSWRTRRTSEANVSSGSMTTCSGTRLMNHPMASIHSGDQRLWTGFKHRYADAAPISCAAMAHAAYSPPA